MPMTQKNRRSKRSSFLHPPIKLVDRLAQVYQAMVYRREPMVVAVHSNIKTINSLVELVDALVKLVNPLVEPVDALVELLDPFVDAGHHSDQVPQHTFDPNQCGSDLLHLHLEERQPFFHYRHFEPPHDTVVATVSQR